MSLEQIEGLISFAVSIVWRKRTVGEHRQGSYEICLAREKCLATEVSMAKKYDPLKDFLVNLPVEVTEKTLSFIQIDQILDSSLPPSAHDWRPWWANQADISNRPQAEA